MPGAITPSFGGAGSDTLSQPWFLVILYGLSYNAGSILFSYSARNVEGVHGFFEKFGPTALDFLKR
jgi:hypothetical protein